MATAAGITRVADVTGLDRIGVPTAMVVRPNSRSLSVFQGKGLDLASAKVSGLMEAIETHHAECLDWPVRLLAWDQVRGTARAVDPRLLPRPPGKEFDPARRLPWVEAEHLAESGRVLVPLELVHTAYAQPLPDGYGVFVMSTNGLASGNSYCEAICHALCEVIERDAWARFQHESPNGSPTIDLRSLTGENAAILARIEDAGCDVEILEITADVGVPVFFATIQGGSDSPATARPASGLGCHPDREWACTRALIEAAQSRLTRIVGARDDLVRSDYSHESSPAAVRHGGGDVRPLSEARGSLNDTVEADLVWICRRLSDAGFKDVFVFDLSRRDFGIPVVRVLVPGLNHPSGQMIPRRPS